MDSLQYVYLYGYGSIIIPVLIAIGVNLYITQRYNYTLSRSLEIFSKTLLTNLILFIFTGDEYYIKPENNKIKYNYPLPDRYNSYLENDQGDLMLCTGCNITFYTSDSIKTMSGIYPCPFCAGNKTCLNSQKHKYLLRQAKKAPVSDELYCIDCDKMFTQKQSIQTDIGIVPCPYCAGQNTCLDTLKDHEIKVQNIMHEKNLQPASHLSDSPGEKLYCVDCDKKFDISETIKTQSGIYPCPYCAGKYTCIDTLERKQSLSHNNQYSNQS